MAQDKHRVALVTGGMGGLGEAVCVKLAALGYTVVTTHSPGNTKAQDWLVSMGKQGLKFHAYPCDVVDWGSCVACVAQVVKDVGPVDVLEVEVGLRLAQGGPRLAQLNVAASAAHNQSLPS